MDNRQRNVGIDCLRILSMLGVVILHVSGWENYIKIFSSNYYCIYAIKTLTLCSVDCFALISGYNLYNKNVKLHNLIYLHINVLFYSVGIMLVMKLFTNINMTASDIIYSFLPVMSSRYWYYSAYFGMFLLIPAMNILIERSSEKEDRLILLSIITVGTFLTLLKDGNDVTAIGLRQGYSTMWLCLCYCAGGIIHKYRIMKHISIKKLIYWGGVCLLITYTYLLFADYCTVNYGLAESFRCVLFKYNSPTIFVYSLVLLEIFSRINIKNSFIQKMIRILAQSSFGVYLIHGNLLVMNHVIKGLCDFISDVAVPVVVGTVFCESVFIYCICTLIDLVRFTMFKLLHVQNICSRVEQRVERVVGLLLG